MNPPPKPREPSEEDETLDACMARLDATLDKVHEANSKKRRRPTPPSGGFSRARFKKTKVLFSNLHQEAQEAVEQQAIRDSGFLKRKA